MNPSSIEIIFENQDFWIVDKPRKMFVHPPEDSTYPVPREEVLLFAFRDQIGQYLYPVHRIDYGTCGLVIFAKNSQAARELNEHLHAGNIQKTYRCLVRGWPTVDVIEEDLKSDSSNEFLPARTEIKILQTYEREWQIGTRVGPSRYALIQAIPKTGRFHQIRRHLNRIAHPIIGDSSHGDSRHNRYFREQLGWDGLCLQATELNFLWKGAQVHAKSRFEPQWTHPLPQSVLKNIPAFQSHFRSQLPLTCR